jgi:uncharacterized protein
MYKTFLEVQEPFFKKVLGRRRHQQMRFLIDLQHPAHLHFFRPLVGRLEAAGHEVLVTGRDKDILVRLAGECGMGVEVFGVARKGVFNLGKELIYRQWRLNRIIGRFRPDVMMAIAGTFIGIPGWLRRIPTYVFYDTEHATVSNLLSYPFVTCVYVPRCYRKEIRWNHVRYDGYHELAYLHPGYFEPDESVLGELGLERGEIFTLIRLVNWGAGHDIGLSGLSRENKKRAILAFAEYGRVFISSEEELPEELEQYRLRLKVSKVHSLMSYASMIFGESATMVSEGAVLGVPGVYIDPVGRGYTDEQEREYGIVHNYTHLEQGEAIERGVAILEGYRRGSNEERQKWKAVGKRIVEEKIDVTGMMWTLFGEGKAVGR